VLVFLSGFLRKPCDCDFQKPARAGLDGFVSWVWASLDDRDLVFQDRSGYRITWIMPIMPASA
jgi:hypothetical protein